jgi:ubiquinone/menaquinone biosynthesis C-methylase UbiE
MPDTANRVQREAEFHDALIHSDERGFSFYQLGADRHEVRRLFHLAGDLSGKTVLDFGCGCGWITVELVRPGAEVHAFDISEESLKAARAYAVKKGVADRIQFRRDNAEALSYEDNIFDIVVGGAILHHLDLDAAFGEIHRILKPGGRALFLEPLGHNLVINLYRRLTPDKRTPDEHPLLIPDLRARTAQFTRVTFEYFYFLALLAFPIVMALKKPALFKTCLDFLCKVDARFLQLAPPFRRYCWSAIIILEK